MIRREEEVRNFLSNTEFSEAELYPLAGDASARRYMRVKLSDKQAMLMDTPAEGENFPAFVAIAEYLYTSGYSSPNILARDMQTGFLLLEDLGDKSFTYILTQQKEEMEATLYGVAIDILAMFYNLDNKNLPQLPLYDEELYLREVCLFADWFLPQIIGNKKSADLRGEYLDIWRKILRSFPLGNQCFVHRDFHADNLMWLPQRDAMKRVGLLDFQDAVMGDPVYDIVSLLEDARRDVSPEIIESMIARYLHKTGTDSKRFLNAYDILGAQRNSKIIGIFIRLALRDGKENYLHFLPRVWTHLERDLKNPLLKELREWLDSHVSAEARSEVKICHSL